MSLINPINSAITQCPNAVDLIYNVSSFYGLSFSRTDNYKQEFLRINGYKAYPILVNEHLFKFLTIISSFLIIATLILLAVIALCFLNRFCMWFCHTHDKPIVKLNPQGRSNLTGKSCTIKLHHRSTYRARSFAPDKFVGKPLNQPTYSNNNELLITSFECSDAFGGVGHFLQIVPKTHCQLVNCRPRTCDNPQHIVFLFIPCDSFNGCQQQVRILLPDNPLPLKYKEVLIKNLQSLAKEPDRQEPEPDETSHISSV